MNSLRFLLAVLLATLAAAPVAAQTLTPEEALRSTIERNPQLQELGLTVRAATLDAEAQMSLRPFTLRGDTGFQFDEQPSVGVIESGVRQTTMFRGSAELLKQFVIGTSLSLRLDINRTVSEIPFTVPDLGISETRVFGPNYFTGLTLAATQPLLRGAGKELGELPLTLARQQVDVARLQKLRAANDLVAEALNAYWAWVGAYFTLEAQRNSLARTRVLSEATIAQIEAGQLAELERDIVAQRIAAAEQGIVAAEAAVIDAAEALRKTMGIDIAIDAAFEPPRVVPTDPPAIMTMEEALQHARATNPDLRLLDQEVRASELSLVRSRDLVRPQLDAVATVSQLGLAEDIIDSLEHIGTFDFSSVFLGLQFGIPLDNRLAKKQLEADEVALQAARLRREQALREVELRLRQARRLLETQKRRLALSETEIELARKNLAAMQDKFRAGLASNLEVLQLEEDLSAAEARYNQARLDVATSRIGLRRVTGTLLEHWDVELER